MAASSKYERTRARNMVSLTAGYRSKRAIERFDDGMRNASEFSQHASPALTESSTAGGGKRSNN